MPTQRTKAQLMTALADNNVGAITPSVMRDVVESVFPGAPGSSIRLTPTTFEDFLPNGVTDPYTPVVQSGNFADGTQSRIHVRVAANANAMIYSLPRAPEGTICVLTHAGDGGNVTDQASLLQLKHMHPAYDGSNGGDNSVRVGFYCPGQRNIVMMPADTVVLSMDEGHVSWRVIAQTNSGRVLWSIADQLSIGYDGILTLPTLQAGDNDLVGSATDALASVWRIITDAAGSNIVGMRPPPAKHWNGSAYKAHGTFKLVYNTGPGNLIIKMNASASAEYKIVGDALSNHLIPIWGSRWFMYDPIHNFWLLTSKP